MKNLILLLLVLVSVITLAACGGANAPSNNAAPKDKDAGHKDHHEHEGDRFELGKKKIGDMDVAVVYIHNAKEPNEAVFEVNTGLAGDKNKDLKVTVWIGDKDGKELSPKKTADYAKDHNDFDGHCEVPKNKPAEAWAWVEIGGNKAGYELKLK
ncbi:MAG: hypothetical protein IT462_04355 [Planctomycetes bacterium]|nr:hypothetical protein [Planctomycetota bacterium]